MKKTLNMVCPHCKLKAELRIEEEAEMILMRCVSCSAPYLYFHGETFEVNEEEMDHLRSAEMKEVEGLMKFDDAEKEEHFSKADIDVLKEIEPNQPLEGSLMKPTTSAEKKFTEVRPERELVIQKDEILNLVIDLETTGDVSEFISRLEGAA